MASHLPRLGNKVRTALRPTQKPVSLMETLPPSLYPGPYPKLHSPRHRWKFLAAGTFLLLSGIGVGFSIGMTVRSPQQTPVALEAESLLANAIPVSTLVTESVDTYNVTRAFTGEVVALHASELGFDRPGKVIEIFVDDGDRVTRGTPLARLDTRNLETQRLAIKAQLLQVEAVIRDLEEQLKLSEVQLDRREGLLVEGAISREQRDEFSFGTDSLRARRDVQVASIQQLEAQLADIDVTLDKSILRAPFDGGIAQRYIDRGTVAEAGRPILRLVDTSDLEARIGLPAEMADRLELGSSHAVLIDNHSYQAVVKATLPEIDLATRTRTVVLVLDNAAGVVPGEVIRLELQGEPIATSGFWLPLSALVQGERGLWSTYALTAADSVFPGLYRVERRDVEVLHTEGDLALVRGTLRPGETLVDTGVHRVVPGQLVRPLSSYATTQIETQS